MSDHRRGFIEGLIFAPTIGTPIIFATSVEPYVLLPVLLAVLFAGSFVFGVLLKVDPPTSIHYAPTCPYCAPIETKTTLSSGVPAVVVLRIPAKLIMERRWAWCGRCGAIYKHADGVWEQPDPAFLQGAYRAEGDDVATDGRRIKRHVAWAESVGKSDQ